MAEGRIVVVEPLDEVLVTEKLIGEQTEQWKLTVDDPRTASVVMYEKNNFNFFAPALLYALYDFIDTHR